MSIKKIKPTLQLQLEDSILAFHRMMTDELRTEALRLKFSASGLEVLRYVAEKGNPTMKDIAAHLSITPPSVTTIVEALIKKELLKREFDPNDRRITRIILAPKAWKLFTKLKDKKLVILKNTFSRLGAHDQKELMRILSLVTK